MNGARSFNPKEFLDGLKRNDLQQPVSLRGMVKADETSDDYLLFAHGSICENWIKIPLASIEAIELLNMVPCKDHSHPLVTLRLKQPESAEGRLMASILAAAPRRSDRGPTIVQGPRNFGRNRERMMSRDDAGIGPDPRWPWCDSIPKYQIDVDGTVECLNWCWESEHRAQYSPGAC